MRCANSLLSAQALNVNRERSRHRVINGAYEPFFLNSVADSTYKCLPYADDLDTFDAAPSNQEELTAKRQLAIDGAGRTSLDLKMQTLASKSDPKGKGKVRLVAPSLTSDEDEDEDEDSANSEEPDDVEHEDFSNKLNTLAGLDDEDERTDDEDKRAGAVASASSSSKRPGKRTAKADALMASSKQDSPNTPVESLLQPVVAPTFIATPPVVPGPVDVVPLPADAHVPAVTASPPGSPELNVPPLDSSSGTVPVKPLMMRGSARVNKNAQVKVEKDAAAAAAAAVKVQAVKPIRKGTKAGSSAPSAKKRGQDETGLPSPKSASDH